MNLAQTIFCRIIRLWMPENKHLSINMKRLPLTDKRYNIMFVLIVLSLLTTSLSQTSVSPTWAHNAYFQAGSAAIITSRTGAPYQNTFTIPFTINTATNPPFIAIGVKSYQGTDFLIQQFFNLSVVNYDNTQVQVQLYMVGITNPQLIQISYIAIQQDYPYNINTYTGIDLNYSSGPLQNVTTMSSTIQTHTEIVDYATDQFYWAVAGNYATFLTPLANNKILFFLTTLYIVSTTLIPIQLDLSYTILSDTAYSMSLSAGYNVSITRFSFSQIFFFTGDYQGPTISPYLNGFEWDISNTLATTNIIDFPNILSNQFIVGLKSFYTTSGQAILSFNSQFGTYSGNNGLQVFPSTPTNSSNIGLSYEMVSILYMMDWSCPGGSPYYNLVTFLCQDFCGPYYYTNITDMTCRACSNSLCYSCSTSNISLCLSCDTNFVLSGGTCVCDMSTLAKVFVNNSICYLCSDLQFECIQCSYTLNSSSAYNSTDFTCLNCNNTAGYFIDINNDCSLCIVTNCQTCVGYTTCSVCNSGFGVTASGSCSTCPLTGCLTCSTLTVCLHCALEYTLVSGLCYFCQATCNCGGYTLPQLANGDCSTICGDGILLNLYQQCDDGNTINGDGCSSTCNIQTNSTCIGQPSVCYYNQNINLELISTQVSTTTCNEITFHFQIIPNLIIFQLGTDNWNNFITPNNGTLTYVTNSVTEANGILSISYLYSQTIQDQQLEFTVYPATVSTSIYLSQVPSFSTWATVNPNNNLAAVYYSSSLCNQQIAIGSYYTAQTAIAYIGLLFSVFSLKIVGLEMFGVLQLSYFILSDYDYVNPLFVDLLDRKSINGINTDTGSSGAYISSRVVLNGYDSQQFLSNLNIMFYLTVGLSAGGIAMYMITYFINKNIQEASNLNLSLKQEENQSKTTQELEQKQSKSIFLHRISKYLLKEVLMTFLIFNIFNISFSAGIQIKYINNVDPWSIVAMLVTFTMTIVMIVAQYLTDKMEFGQYLHKFKPSTLPANYITATLIYRFTLGLLMALLNEWQSSGIVFVFVSVSFLTYIFYCQPFLDQFQNLRTKVVHSVHVLILLINYYYRMDANYDEISSNYFIIPAYIQLAAVGAVVMVSTLGLCYEAVKWVKTKCRGEDGEEGKAQENKISIFEEVHQENILNMPQEEPIYFEGMDQ